MKLVLGKSAVSPEGNLYIAGGYTSALHRSIRAREEALFAAFQQDNNSSAMPKLHELHGALQSRLSSCIRLNDVFELNTRRKRWRMLRRSVEVRLCAPAVAVTPGLPVSKRSFCWSL